MVTKSDIYSDISITHTDTASCICGLRFNISDGLPFKCLPVAVIVELIVGGERNEASPSSRQREEDLSGCIFPHLRKGRGVMGKLLRETNVILFFSFFAAAPVDVVIKAATLCTFASLSFSHFGVIK